MGSYLIDEFVGRKQSGEISTLKIASRSVTFTVWRIGGSLLIYATTGCHKEVPP